MKILNLIYKIKIPLVSIIQNNPTKSDECFNNLNITPHITINTTRNPHIIDDLILSMIIQIDSFLLRMVSNDFDERSKIISEYYQVKDHGNY